MFKRFVVHLTIAAAITLGSLGAISDSHAADFILKYGHPGPVGPDSDDDVAGQFLKFFLAHP